VALGSLLYKLIGLLLIIPVLDPLVHWMDSLDFSPQEMVIGFHLLYNTARCLILLPSVGPMAGSVRGCCRSARKPTARPSPGTSTRRRWTRPAWRWPTRPGNPAHGRSDRQHAGSHARCAARQADRRDPGNARLTDDVEALYSAIKLYLAQMPREDLSEQDSRRWAEIIELAINLKLASDLIERMLRKVQQQKTSQRRSFSEVGLEELAGLHSQLIANLRLGLSVFLSADKESARQLLREKRRFRAQERRLAHAHVSRLQRKIVQSIETSSLHLELIADMKR
jgi:phosphate:Na+ symporter